MLLVLQLCFIAASQKGSSRKPLVITSFTRWVANIHVLASLSWTGMGSFYDYDVNKANIFSGSAGRNEEHCTTTARKTARNNQFIIACLTIPGPSGSLSHSDQLCFLCPCQLATAWCLSQDEAALVHEGDLRWTQCVCLVAYWLWRVVAIKPYCFLLLLLTTVSTCVLWSQQCW